MYKMRDVVMNMFDCRSSVADHWWLKCSGFDSLQQPASIFVSKHLNFQCEVRSSPLACISWCIQCRLPVCPGAVVSLCCGDPQHWLLR